MNVMASECGSGCESGWTLYLEHSLLLPNPSLRNSTSKYMDDENAVSYHEYMDKRVEEAEDLSMVSDASSGPPHFVEDDECHNYCDNQCFHSASVAPALAKSSSKRKKVQENRRRQRCKEQEQLSLLDDTASSPIFNFSDNNRTITNNQGSVEDMLGYSHGFSATHFEDRSTFQTHYGFLGPSVPGNRLQQNEWLQDKRWG
ncbi:hypothetical protein RJ641_013512 [Dillenia turbinata]|uniref:Uncharacterized protein n=1 Tax=Dillenia turbinata TaxID=194707 RepID=A0AAN8W461_9MAGN